MAGRTLPGAAVPPAPVADAAATPDSPPGHGDDGRRLLSGVTSFRVRLCGLPSHARVGVVVLVRGGVEQWRRSLQLRVVVTTALATAVAVIVLGVLLLNVVTSGLLEAKRRAAHAEVGNGLEAARTQLYSVRNADAENLPRTLTDITQDLSRRGTSAGLFYVVLFADTNPEQQRISSGLPDDYQQVPDDLRRVVATGQMAEAYGPIQLVDGTVTKGLIVGAPTSGGLGKLELYYLFPLDSEDKTLALVQRTVLLVGLLLVALVAGIAVLVTRQVVRPVRMAAQTAERLSAGRLQERMQVRGKDDLAALASAFNDMADSLQRQITQLEGMSRLQRRFTSDVSHELRTPLTTVRMAADLLYGARDDFVPEVARSAELLQAELNRFEALLTDLLEISRYDAQVAVLESEATDLRPLVERVVAATGAIAARQGCEVRVTAPDEPVIAEVDPRRVERILRNLLVNAAEHGQGRPVEVRLLGDSSAVAVTVRDHGAGLRPGEAGLVFDRFWRADPSRDRRTGGTGLGLSISLEDARLHGGWLHAWGRPGRGAQFRLTLPVRCSDSVVASPLPTEPTDEFRHAAVGGVHNRGTGADRLVNGRGGDNAVAPGDGAAAASVLSTPAPDDVRTEDRW